MTKFFNPDTIFPPQAAYTHGVIVPEGTELLFIAGQLGVMPDGTVADGIDAQAEWAFKNMRAILEDAGMGPENLVKLLVCVTEQEFRGPVMAAREKILDGVKPASTLLVVKGLAQPQFLFEVEGVAAKS